MAASYENTTYYLKYRPKALDELVGQDLVKKTLKQAFDNNKLSHAYLFVGPRGTGKTSTARILAKMVNCEMIKASDSSIPCNNCPTCISITDGSNLDLIEIDAASNRGIEDIRFLREKIKLAPTSSKKKVYIIDEVHMLTTEAFNALLKTLEEPPPHVLFILATTEGTKIPQTILSRVQRLDFKLARIPELLQALKKITDAEKLEIDEQVLKELSKKAEGSFRDGIKLLDQVASLGGKVNIKDLEEVFKTGQLDDVFLILESFAQKDTKKSLETLHKILENGTDPKNLVLNIMDTLRNLLFIKNGLGESLVEVQYSEESYQNLKNLAQNFTNADFTKLLNLLQESNEKLKFTSIQSLPLELAIVEICESDTKLNSDPVSQIKSDEIRKSENQNVSEPADVPVSSDISDSSNSDIQKLQGKWTYVCETIRPYNFSLEALLRSIQITDCNQSAVILSVPYSFHQRILESPKNRELVESVISEVLGRIIKVVTVLGTRPQRKEDIANIEVAADDEIIRAAAEIFNSDSIN